jgi:hypothetical protein
VGESGGGFSGGTGGFSIGDVPERMLLVRVLVGRFERFGLLSPITRFDPRYSEAHIVPRDPATFHSDLTSVPRVFTWLIPRTGAHLPAAILHDALVSNPPQASGPHVDRLEADRIFRDAMGELGTSLLRRWLMWTAVVIATIHCGATPSPWRHRMALYLSAVLIVGLGIIGTLCVVGVPVFRDGPDPMSWMADWSWPVRMMAAAAAAVITPIVLAPLWGSLWRAGLIAGWALAALLHVTALLLAFSLIFWGLERGLDLAVGFRLRCRVSRRSAGAIRRRAHRGGRSRWWQVRPRTAERIPRPN